MIPLYVFSDPVCPWCYIGKANLDRALESRPDHLLQVEWHPFQLNPDMPAQGADRRAYLEAKFGGKAEAARAYANVIDAATAAGVEINLEKMDRQPNTMNAHRLIHWAGLEGRQNAVVAALFRAYFRDGRDIGDAPTLAAIAAEAGMDHAVTLRLLATDADLDDLPARDADARHKPVRAVPTFVLAREYVLQGAQPVALWQQVIDDLAQQVAAQAPQ